MNGNGGGGGAEEPTNYGDGHCHGDDTAFGRARAQGDATDTAASEHHAATNRKRQRTEQHVPAVESYEQLGLTVSAFEAFVRRHETTLLRAARQRRVRELLCRAVQAPVTDAELDAHASEVQDLSLEDAIGYDLWVASMTISSRYAALSDGDQPSLIEIILGDAEAAGEVDAARSVRRANRFLSWHMGAKLLDVINSQREMALKASATTDADVDAEANTTAAELYWWNNLFAIRQGKGGGGIQGQGQGRGQGRGQGQGQGRGQDQGQDQGRSSITRFHPSHIQ